MTRNEFMLAEAGLKIVRDFARYWVEDQNTQTQPFSHGPFENYDLALDFAKEKMKSCGQ